MKHFLKHLYKEIKSNLFDYLLLVTAGVFFIAAINIFRGEKLMEFIILLIFVTFYIVWGIYHHIMESGLHLKIVLEYILIGFTFIFLLKLVILP
jgi:hypothetical protein